MWQHLQQHCKHLRVIAVSLLPCQLLLPRLWSNGSRRSGRCMCQQLSWKSSSGECTSQAVLQQAWVGRAPMFHIKLMSVLESMKPSRPFEETELSMLHSDPYHASMLHKSTHVPPLQSGCHACLMYATFRWKLRTAFMFMQILNQQHTVWDRVLWDSSRQSAGKARRVCHLHTDHPQARGHL